MFTRVYFSCCDFYSVPLVWNECWWVSHEVWSDFFPPAELQTELKNSKFEHIPLLYLFVFRKVSDVLEIHIREVNVKVRLQKSVFNWRWMRGVGRFLYCKSFSTCVSIEEQSYWVRVLLSQSVISLQHWPVWSKRRASMCNISSFRLPTLCISEYALFGNLRWIFISGTCPLHPWTSVSPFHPQHLWQQVPQLSLLLLEELLLWTWLLHISFHALLLVERQRRKKKNPVLSLCYLRFKN